MYTIDASVWVNAFDQREPGHENSRRFLDHVHALALPVIVPNLVAVEVAGAVSRTRGAPAAAQAFAAALLQLPNVTVMPLDEDSLQQAIELAARHGLRGADAVYAAVAAGSGCKLVTLDAEHLSRLGGVVMACTPPAALEELLAEPAEAGDAPPEVASPGSTEKSD